MKGGGGVSHQISVQFHGKPINGSGSEVGVGNETIFFFFLSKINNCLSGPKLCFGGRFLSAFSLFDS